MNDYYRIRMRVTDASQTFTYFGFSYPGQFSSEEVRTWYYPAKTPGNRVIAQPVDYVMHSGDIPQSSDPFSVRLEFYGLLDDGWKAYRLGKFPLGAIVGGVQVETIPPGRAGRFPVTTYIKNPSGNFPTQPHLDPADPILPIIHGRMLQGAGLISLETRTSMYSSDNTANSDAQDYIDLFGPDYKFIQATNLPAFYMADIRECKSFEISYTKSGLEMIYFKRDIGSISLADYASMHGALVALPYTNGRKETADMVQLAIGPYARKGHIPRFYMSWYGDESMINYP